MAVKRKPDFEKICMLVVDIDGVMTDGSLIINEDGTESKKFSSLDGHGIRLWQRAGGKVAFLSGRSCRPVEHRAEQLDVDFVLQDCFDKLPEMKKLLEKANLEPQQAAYVGDDLPDLPVIRYVGFGVAVANSVDEVKKYADFVTVRPGGSGAVREVIEHILRKSGKWQRLMDRYIPDQHRGG